MSRFRHVPNKEWGRKHRKEEDRMRGLNGKDRRQAVDEQLEDWQANLYSELINPTVKFGPIMPPIHGGNSYRRDLDTLRTMMMEERLVIVHQIDRIRP